MNNHSCQLKLSGSPIVQESIKIYRDWMGLPTLEKTKKLRFQEWLVRLKLLFAVRSKRQFKEMIKLRLPKGY